MKIEIRSELSIDYEAIKFVTDEAFGQELEGELVEKLRANPVFKPELSLVALWESKLIGHILFFPINIKSKDSLFPTLALAPMAVLPVYQRNGIGSQLVRAGLKTAANLGYNSVIVLGHNDFYPKFGFRPASDYGISAPFEVPNDVFMAFELIPNGLAGISGIVQYPAEFDDVS
jgi:putative acetyltransferase